MFEGKILALLGENGARKTTLMNMLFGHYMPDDGSIDIMAEDEVGLKYTSFFTPIQILV